MACNTSSGQYFTLETSVTLPLQVHLVVDWQLFLPPKTSSFLGNWTGTCNSIFGIFSLAYPAAEHLSSVSIIYPVTGQEPNPLAPNIAAGDWTLSVESDSNTSYLSYAPNGTATAVSPQTLNPPTLPTYFQFSLGFIFPLFYWPYLADFGQTSTIVYPNFTSIQDMADTPFAVNKQLPPTYNIFVNETLYEDMTAFLLNWTGLDNTFPLPSFDEKNGFPLEPSETFLVVSYSCTQRQLKSPVSLIVTVIAADYALIVGGYSIVKWIAMFLETRRKKGDLILPKQG